MASRQAAEIKNFELLQLIRQESGYISLVPMYLSDDGRADGREVRGGDQKNRFQFAIQMLVHLSNAVFIFKVSGIAQAAE